MLTVFQLEPYLLRYHALFAQLVRFSQQILGLLEVLNSDVDLQSVFRSMNQGSRVARLR